MGLCHQRRGHKMHLARGERQNIKEGGRRWAACTCLNIIFDIGGGCRARAHKRERRK